jgi:class 3 adenylate cyclase
MRVVGSLSFPGSRDPLVEKFIGDAIMAIFGIDDMLDMPLRAIKAATDMLGAADAMKPHMKTMYRKEFEIGIGLHYGQAVIGTVSGGREEKLAAIGETVNVASRIESANKEAGTRLLISEALYQQVEKQVESIRLSPRAAARHQRAHVALRGHPADTGSRSAASRPRQPRDHALRRSAMDAPGRRGRNRRRRAAGFRVRVRPALLVPSGMESE